MASPLNVAHCERQGRRSLARIVDMKILVRLFTALALIYSSVDPASAKYAIRGVGSNTCGAFISVTEGFAPGKGGKVNWLNHDYFSEAELYTEWAEAYVTATIFDRDLNDVMVIKDVPSFDLWLRNWCSGHPTNYFFEAVEAFLRSEGVLK
jgi:hypothetical protein